MPSSSDLLIGQIAIQLGLIDRRQLNDCIRIQEAGSPPVPLGEILLAKEYVTREQLDQVLAIQKKNLQKKDPSRKVNREDTLFGKIVLKEKLATSEQVNECLRIQASQGNSAGSLGQIMIQKGYLDREQVHKILTRQLKKIMRCNTCRLSFTVVSTTGGKNAKCPRCQGLLEDAPKTDSVSTQGEIATVQMRALRVPPPPPKKKKDFTCVICNYGFKSTPDNTGRVSCPECNTTFSPRNR